jgi:hypothetical protein
MFYASGSLKPHSWSVGNLGKWDVSNVTDIRGMFGLIGQYAQSVDLGDLSNWDVSKVTDMGDMFHFAGVNSKTFKVGDISKWDAKNVTDFTNMFNHMAMNVAYTLDLTSWNVRSKPHTDFALTNEAKITY